MFETNILRPLNSFVELCVVGDQVARTKVTTWTSKSGVTEHFLKLTAFVLNERSEPYLFVAFRITHFKKLVAHARHSLQCARHVLTKHFFDRPCLKTKCNIFCFCGGEKITECKGCNA